MPVVWRPVGPLHERREPDVLLEVAKRCVEGAGAVVGGAGLEREVSQAAGRAPRLGGGHEGAGDAAALHAGRRDEFADVSVYLAGEVGALGRVHDADDLLILNGDVNDVTRPPGRVSSVTDPLLHSGEPRVVIAPRRLAFGQPRRKRHDRIPIGCPVLTDSHVFRHGPTG